MEDPPNLITAGKLLAVIVLVLTNGFFVAAEFSLVAMRRSRVEQLIAEGHPLAPPVQRAVQHLDAYLAATQLGITMASLGLGWIGEPALAHIIEGAFTFLPAILAQASSHAIAVTIAFVIITVLHIVLGELAPKSLALQRTESTALAVGRPLEVFLFVFRPAILTLNRLGNLVLQIFGLPPTSGEESVHSPEELKLLVSASHEAGLVGVEAEGIVERAFEFDEFLAHQVMVPRTEITCVSVGATVEEALHVAIEHHHTRLPVYEESLDNVVGLVHLADLVQGCWQKSPPDLRSLTQPALVVPESIRADVLLTRMREGRAQMAILFDEYGGTAGLVTIHDLVERLVGPVLDVQEATSDGMEQQTDGSVRIGGLALIHDVNERFGLEIDDQEYSTVNGFIQAQLGRLPQPGDEVRADGYVFRVESLEGRRVETIRVAPVSGDSAATAKADAGAEDTSR